MTGRTGRTTSAGRPKAAANDGRNNEPNQEVVAERLRKARQSVMANRSDRDPPSLHVMPGRKAHRRNEARIGRFHQGQRAESAASIGGIQSCNLPDRHTEIDLCVPGGVHPIPPPSGGSNAPPPWHIAMPSGGGVHSIIFTPPLWCIIPPPLTGWVSKWIVSIH